MRRGKHFASFGLTVLLLPGLVLAAPTAGACGHCDRGVPCASMTAPEPAAAEDSCCGEAKSDAPVAPEPSSLGLAACDCGRAAPQAVAAAQAPAPDRVAAHLADAWISSVAVTLSVAFAALDRHPLPPPAPPLYLIDCVSLT